MAIVILPGQAAGDDVKALKAGLRKALGTEAAQFPSCDDPATGYDPACLAAVRQLQSRAGLQADGIAGPLTQSLLGLDRNWPVLAVAMPVDVVRKMFPFTRRSNIERYLPYVLAALRAVGTGAEAGRIPVEIILSALGTIRAESEGFIPISEMPSKFNTTPGQPPFSAYVGRLGNANQAEAEAFKGRGFVQLTGHVNYAKYGKPLGIDLVAQPELGNHPEVAAALLAVFVASVGKASLEALRRKPVPDFKTARRLVNGGSHGLDRYQEAYQLGLTALVEPAPVAAAGATRVAPAKASRKSRRTSPSTPPPVAASRRPDRAHADPLDLRDRSYQPRVGPLPHECPPREALQQHLSDYVHGAKLILDQGREGSCTGFGLACVINFQRWRLAGHPNRAFPSVSPRMLYELARRYDEFEGEKYEGSSCRGAIRGFHHNGVCFEDDWPYDPDVNTEPNTGWLERARSNTLGVYYRVDTKSLTDLQAAIVEAGAVYVSANTHDGWNAVPSVRVPKKAQVSIVPDIVWPRPLNGGGHSFALVGFDALGFVIQNSWGTGWGAGGFARLSYADWIANAMDAWVLSLGVPGVLPRSIGLKLPAAANAPAGLSDASTLEARRYTVEMGNDGRIDSHYGEDIRLQQLDYQACSLPADWFRAHAGSGPWRLALYAHGGLTNLEDALKKTATMAPYFVGNGIYPLFLAWETGSLETAADMLQDGWNKITRDRTAPAGGGVGDWLRERRDEAIEGIARGPARAMWSEMKQNAARAEESRHGLDFLALALRELSKVAPKGKLEVHLVGHSAGSILHGRLLHRLRADGVIEPSSIHLYAPACTVAFANECFGPWFDRTFLHVMTDHAELADHVTQVYGKSLLYLVANALEPDKRTPILGMARSFDPAANGSWNGLSTTLDALNRLQAEWTRPAQRRNLFLYDARITTCVPQNGQPAVTEVPSHGGFDNDVAVLTRVLASIIGKAPAFPVLDLRQA